MSFYQPQFQQYQSQFQPQYQPQLQLQPQGLMGRFISSENDISAQEVSMNSTPSYFPLNDGSAVIAKQWQANGKVATVRYVPDSNADESPSEPTMADVMSALDDLKTCIDDLKPKTRRTARKEAGDAED